MIRKILCIVPAATIFILSSSASAASSAKSKIPIANFSSVVPHALYRGARPTLTPIDEIEWLANFGIKTDIDLQGGDLDNPGITKIVSWMEPGEKPANVALEKARVTSLLMTFINTPLNSLADVTANESQTIDYILDTMSNPKYQPVFIHCEHGKDRTGLLVALYRVRFQNWSPARAHREWVKHGHGLINQVFTHEMDQYFYQKVKTISALPNG